MKVIMITQQCWTGMFNETIKWYNYNLNVDDILSITPKEIYVEDLTLLSHFEHDSKFLKALGSTVQTNNGEITTLQSPDEINQLIQQTNYNSKALSYNELRDYINIKARSYPENNYILTERDQQEEFRKKQNQIIKYICLFLLVTFIVFSIIYPQKSYEVINTSLQCTASFIKDITRVFFGGFM